jgi:hypothetical protein
MRQLALYNQGQADPCNTHTHTRDHWSALPKSTNSKPPLGTTLKDGETLHVRICYGSTPALSCGFRKIIIMRTSVMSYCAISNSASGSKITVIHIHLIYILIERERLTQTHSPRPCLPLVWPRPPLPSPVSLSRCLPHAVRVCPRCHAYASP